MKKKHPKEDPSGYGKGEAVSPEILALYVWGVFKEGKNFYSNIYHPDMTYPTLVKGNLSKEDSISIAFSMKKK
jgi:hypothetical protein